MRKYFIILFFMFLPIVTIAEIVEIDGIYYEIITKAKIAEVTTNPNKYAGNVIIPPKVIYNGIEYNVTTIGYRAFSGSYDMTSVSIPNSVTTICTNAFASCTGLNNITIPKTVNRIGDMAFYGCYNLTAVYITDIKAWCEISYDGLAFYYGHKLYINGEEIKDLIIPNEVTIIKHLAFAYCTGLTSVTISDGVTTICSEAFGGCTALTSFTIPNSVTNIEESAFTNVTSDEVSFHISSLETLFKNSVRLNEKYRLYINGDEVNVLEFPDGLTSINRTFSNCLSLRSVIIPNSVTTIEDDAFSGCSNLSSVTIPNSVTSIGNGAFLECSALTAVTPPNSVTSIGHGAFYGCKSLTSITIPNSVTSIERQTFQGCSALTSVTIGIGLTSIDNNAFANCQNLTNVYCMADNVPLSNSDAFAGSYIEYATLHVPKGCTDAYRTAEPWKNFKSIVEMVDAKVKLSKSKVIIEKGKTLTLKATVTPSDLSDKSVTWKSSNTKVATVSSTGKVKGVKTGSATITCTSNATGMSATCEVTVGKVNLDKSEAVILKGTTLKLTPSVYPTTLEDKSVTWESSDPKIATVTSAGKVKGVKTGTATITCTSKATGLSATCEVIVGKVNLDKSEAVIQKGKTLKLTPSVYPTTLEDKSVIWESSNTKIATVSSTGKVKGVKTGTATITCTSNATGLSATCEVTVGKVNLDKAEVSIVKGKTVTLTPIVYPTTLADKSVTWNSSDEAVATVTSGGKVTGIKAGTATITCTSNVTGLSATCQVTVTASSGTRSLSGDDDETTGIDALGQGEAEPYDVYDLSGRKVRHQVTSLDGLPNGVYIVNGRKVLKKE